MKRRLLKKPFAGTFIIFTSILVFFTQTDGVNLASSNTRNNPETQSRKTQQLPHRRINKAAVSPSSFTSDMPFSEAISILRNSTVPPLNIIVLWKNLEQNADIYRDAPIGIDGVSGVPLRTHLKLLLMSLSAGSVEKLGYVIDGGVIIISTESSLPKKLRTRIYDISDLVGAPANGGFMPGIGMPFGFGGMPFGFGGMMPFGFGGISGGMMPFGGTGYTGQRQQTYGSVSFR